MYALSFAARITCSVSRKWLNCSCKGINKVIAARDRGQRLSPVQNSGEDNIQDTTARLQQVGTD